MHAGRAPTLMQTTIGTTDRQETRSINVVGQLATRRPLAYDRDDAYAKRITDRIEFDEIQSSLPHFKLGNEALRSPEAFGEFDLSKTSALAICPK